MAPIVINLGGRKYRITAFTEIAGMSINGNGSPEIDKLCRAEWLSPYGWKKLRNTNILAKIREVAESADFINGPEFE